MVMATRLFLEG